MNFIEARTALAQRGLNLFASTPMSRLPDSLRAHFMAAGVPFELSHSLILIGHGGRTLWQNLKAPVVASEHPIDRHTLQCVAEFNRDFLKDPDLLQLYPHSPWLIPLQQLGRFLNLAQPSPLGVDLNAEYGPWFAYRAALLTRRELPDVLPKAFRAPCETCADKPCQRACPGHAVSSGPLDLKSCLNYRLSENSRCADRCLARAACPVGAEHRYTDEQVRYHMTRPEHLARIRAMKG